MNVKKPPLVMKEKATERPANNGTTRPKNPPALDNDLCFTRRVEDDVAHFMSTPGFTVRQNAFSARERR